MLKISFIRFNFPSASDEPCIVVLALLPFPSQTFTFTDNRRDKRVFDSFFFLFVCVVSVTFHGGKEQNEVKKSNNDSGFVMTGHRLTCLLC